MGTRAKSSIEKMLATNRKLETASAYASDIKKGSNVAAWHERDTVRLQQLQARLAATAGSLGTITTVVSAVPGSEEEARGVGAKTAVEVARLARRARLRELYAREAQLYEEELQALGMALVKPVV